MTDQLTMKEISSDSRWSPVVRSYQQYSQYEHLEALFERPAGIHGVRHARRVLFHTLVLCKLCGIEEQDQKLLVTASLFHDIGRENDGLCFRHGRLSVEKMLALKLLPENQEFSDSLKFIISFHCIGDDESWVALQKAKDMERENTWRLFCIFKDADGLDRVRINDLDMSYMRNPETLHMGRLANEVLVKI